MLSKALKSRDWFGPGPAQGPTDLGWARPAQIGLGPKDFGPNPSIKEWVWIWPSPRPNQFGLGRAGPNRPWAEKFWPKPIPTKESFPYRIFLPLTTIKMQLTLLKVQTYFDMMYLSVFYCYHTL